MARAYRSDLRRERAVQTRARIVEAAHALFREQGYPATTLQQIAERAGVALPTVTGAFSSKRRLLDEVLRAAVRGDDASMHEQLEAVIAAPDPDTVIARHARLVRASNERAYPLFEILRTAAIVDPELEQRRRRGADDRRRDQAVVALELDRRGAFRPEMSRQAATDLLWLYSSADVYRLFVADRGWPPRRFEEWLRKTLSHALLPAPATAAKPSEAG